MEQLPFGKSLHNNSQQQQQQLNNNNNNNYNSCSTLSSTTTQRCYRTPRTECCTSPRTSRPMAPRVSHRRNSWPPPTRRPRLLIVPAPLSNSCVFVAVAVVVYVRVI
jgi:hypothetical protein